ncbi:MAG: winged helix-turn-helix transcriptional regulator [Promethearchaeota archaeon]
MALILSGFWISSYEISPNSSIFPSFDNPISFYPPYFSSFPFSSLNSPTLSVPSTSQNETVPGSYENGDFIPSNGFTTVTEQNSTSRFFFLNNNTLEINNQNSSTISYHFNFGVQNSDISLVLDKLDQISIDLEKKDCQKKIAISKEFSQSSSINIQWIYKTIIDITVPKLSLETSLSDQSMIRIPIENLLSLNPKLNPADLIPAVWNAYYSQWELLQLEPDNQSFEFQLSDYSGEISESSELKTLKFTFFNKAIGIPTSTTTIPGSASFPSILSVIIKIAVVLVIVLSTFALSSANYRSMIVRTINPNYGMHRLKIDEIFDNENRMNIINAVLSEPGIHFNELKRRCNLQPGQLSWHLNLLLSYGIIKMQKLGQYNTYFPTISENPISKADISIIKSKTTLNILKLIENVPGITASQIAKALNLGRNTVKYHVDKLVEKKFISVIKDGRQFKLSRINN